MASATDIYGSVFENGSVTLLARIVGGNAANIVQADISSIKYSVFALDDQDPDSRAAIDGHSEVSLTPSTVVFNSLQIDSRWTVDAVGYNFRHTLDTSAHQAFPVAGCRYLIEYRLTPVGGQVIVVRFRVNAI
jgi:hypothetical protein